MTGKLGAWLNLAWHFAVHTGTRLPFRRFRRGRDLARFADAVHAEGYVPLDPPARAEFPAFMNCVQCGLCALAGEPLRREPASAWAEAWTFVAGGSRSLAVTPAVASDLPASALAPAAASVCPMGIPIERMAGVIRRMAEA